MSENNEVRFDPMTGQPVQGGQTDDQRQTEGQNAFDPLAEPQKSNKKNTKILIGVIIGVIAVIVIAFVICIASGVFLSKNAKVIKAAANTFEPNELIKDLDASSQLEGGNYTVAVEMEGEAYGENFELKASYQQNTAKKKHAVNGKFVYSGTSVDFHEYMDEEELLVSIPKLYPDTFGYYFNEEKDGYLAELLGDDFFEAFDDLCTTSMNDMASSTKMAAEYTKILKDNYNALEFETVEKEVFKVDGKDRKCKGYTTTLTEENVGACLDELSEVYSEYNKNTVNDVKTMFEAVGLEDDELAELDNNIFDTLKEEIEDMPDLDVTFYIYKNRLAAVCVTGTDETGDMKLDIEFRGGTTPTQNTIITYTLNGDGGSIKILGKTEDSVEKTKIVEVYEGEKTTLMDINYDYKNKELEVKAEDGGFTATIDNSEKGLVIDFKDITDESIDLTVTLKKGSNIKKPEQDVFNIGTASEQDFYDLFYDIEDFTKELQ